MGKQSSRMYYQGKDHKDIYFQGKYHDAMYKGKQLVWEKIYGGRHIPYLCAEGKGRYLEVLYIDDKEIIRVKAKNSKSGTGIESRFVRGDGIVGCVLLDTSILYSKDGQNFKITEKSEPKYIRSDQEKYAMYGKKFLWIRNDSEISTYGWFCSTDMESMDTNVLGPGSNIRENILNGIIPINVHAALYLSQLYDQNANPPYYENLYVQRNDKKIFLNSAGTPFGDVVQIVLGADNEGIYLYFRRFPIGGKDDYYVKKVDYSGEMISTINVTLQQNIDYMCFKSSLYKNGRFICYFSIDGKLNIYETSDFLNFQEKSSPRYISIYDIESGEKKKISFDESEGGDWYLQPYCNLDNTYYFDKEGDIKENTGCLFYDKKKNEDGYQNGYAVFYFDNLYFRESEKNFCKIVN